MSTIRTRIVPAALTLAAVIGGGASAAHAATATTDAARVRVTGTVQPASASWAASTSRVRIQPAGSSWAMQPAGSSWAGTHATPAGSSWA
jgi:hypothetical protein